MNEKEILEEMLDKQNKEMENYSIELAKIIIDIIENNFDNLKLIKSNNYETHYEIGNIGLIAGNIYFGKSYEITYKDKNSVKTIIYLTTIAKDHSQKELAIRLKDLFLLHDLKKNIETTKVKIDKMKEIKKQLEKEMRNEH